MARKGGLKNFFRTLGPGLITAASDDDPSGIGTYASAGASFGYSPLWVVLLSFPLMAAVQLVCARIGILSGEGISTLIRKRYPKPLLITVVTALSLANVINAGVDIGAIGAGINLLIPVPVSVIIVPIAAIILILQLWGSFRLIENVFKWLTLVLFAYVGAAFFCNADLEGVIRGSFVPTIRGSHAYLESLLAVLGTTISPYLFFWQANLEVEEESNEGRTSVSQRRGATASELRNARIDVVAGTGFSTIVSYFIVLTSAATLHQAGATEIHTAAEAARALEPLAGAWAKYLFAVGLIGCGILAVPVLTTSAAYAIAEAFRWRHELNDRPPKSKQFYLTIGIATGIGLLVNYAGINPMRALVLTAVLNGILAGPLLVVIMLLSRDTKVTAGKSQPRWAQIFGWGAAGIMTLAAAAMLIY